MAVTTQELSLLFRDKTVLVTGGTGSIGESLISALLDYGVQRVTVFSKDDSKQYLMKRKYNAGNLDFILGDIRDSKSVMDACRNINFVFHTAALKQIPVCEENPQEAVKTNVIGVSNLIRACIANEVQKVVNISTDKVVNPINIMGITKLLSEKLIAQANDLSHNKKTSFCSVRFGNVINTRGSVLLLWMNQIKKGKQITVTEPKMTRFLMTIPEAVTLILKASYYCRGQEVFILKMNSISMENLLDAVIEHCECLGLDVPEVQSIGIRPGEKMAEELIFDYEKERIWEDKELYVVLPSGTRAYYHFSHSVLREYNSDKASKFSKQEMAELLAYAIKGWS
jgi:FlaA1/EpsC-like NDP-sugar epimerase